MLEHRAHQAIHRDQPGLVRETHRFRDPGLELADKPVGSATRLQMQSASHAGQELLRGVQPHALCGAEQAVVLDGAPAHLLEPAERVDVSQAAAPFLQLGLQQVCGGAEALPPGDGVLREAGGEPVHIRSQPGQDGVRGVGEEFGVPRQQPRIHHRGRHVEPVGGHGVRLLQRAHGMADTEPRIPERVQELFRQRGDGVGRRSVVQDQDVDVGVRAQGAAPKAAERHQRHARRPLPGGSRGLEQLDQRGVHEVRTSPGGPQAVVPG